MPDIKDHLKGEAIYSHLENIVQSSSEIIVRVSDKGIISSWNPSAELALGHTAQEALGQPFERMVPLPEIENTRKVLHRVQLGERVGPLTYTYFHKNGVEKNLSITWSPILDGCDRILGMTLIGRDLTETIKQNKRFQDVEERFADVMHLIPEIIWVTDADGCPYFISDRWSEVTGCPKGVTNTWHEYIHPDDREDMIKSWQEAVKRKDEFEYVYRIKDVKNSYRWYLVRARLSYSVDGSASRWVGFCTDISKQKKTEEALKVADKAKDAFLATLSHELRSPLSVIVGYADLLEDMSRDDKVGFSKAISTIRRASKSQYQLVEDLLEYSRTSQGNAIHVTSQVAIGSLVLEAVENLKLAAEEKKISVTVESEDGEEDLIIKGDPHRIQQVFHNLLNNALKFTPDGGRVLIRVSRKGGKAIISFTDNGIGIDGDTIPYVFERFYQADTSSKRKFPGLGVGLAVVRSIVEMHGGKTVASSKGPSQGSTFTVEFPLWMSKKAPRSEGKGRVKTSQGKPLLGLKIVLLDDQEDLLFMLSELLSCVGAKVSVASDYESALSTALSDKPDVILTDIAMPDIDGFSFLTLIRTDPRFTELHTVPVLALSAYQEEEARRLALPDPRYDFDAYLCKPITQKTLVKTIQIVVTKRNSRSLPFIRSSQSLPKEEYTPIN